jgi:hypothetical protein
VTGACLRETLGLAATASIDNIVDAIDADPPENTITDAPNRRELSQVRTVTHKVIPRVDNALFEQLTAAIQRRNLKISLFRTGAVVHPLVATLDLMFAGSFPDAISPHIETDYMNGRKWFMVCSHLGIVTLVNMKDFKDELDALAKQQEEKARVASGETKATKDGAQ